MPAATKAPSISRSSSTVGKMEERKRPSIDDMAPPSKRQAVNGTKIPKDSNVEMKEESWVESYQKGAIYREMQEYSRKASTAESRLAELHKRSMHHDDHLRIMDAWWRQVLEEMEILAESNIPAPQNDSDPPYLTRVQFADLHDFQKHLEEKGKSIKSRAEALVSRLANSRGDIDPSAAQLECQLAKLLASQKDYMVKLDRLSGEKEQLSEQLNTATLRYFKAEKKLDRARSAQVQNLEQQALAKASGKGSKHASANNKSGESNGDSAELLVKYEEVAAVAKKHKEQLETALAEIKSLQEENSTIKTRRESMTDDEYSRTDVFKQFKAQNEDLIRRINHLEATNRQLKDDSDKLQAERTEFQMQLEMDANSLTHDMEADLSSREQDLARVRSARDELHAEATQRRASQEQERRSAEHMKELVAAKEDRIAALEVQVTRLKAAEDTTMGNAGDVATDDTPPEELRRKLKELEQKYALMNDEIASMEKAYRKTMATAHTKALDFSALEDRVAFVIAEKSKADQKYFAARKDSDTKLTEIRSLRVQNSKSAEIIAQLKEVEAQNRSLLVTLEKQLVELKKANVALSAENKKMEVSSMEAGRRAESLKHQVNDLANLVKTRDASVTTLRERNVGLETDLEKLKARTEHVQKDRDSWKTKALSNSSEEEEMLRTFALCTICRKNFKNTALKTCGHLFCNHCVEDRISNRMRKCPNCSRAFDKMDVMSVHH